MSDEHGMPSLSLVLGYIAVKNLGRAEDRVKVLARLGYGKAEMATICGLTPRELAAAIKSAGVKDG